MRSSTNKIAPNLETVLGRALLMKLTIMFLLELKMRVVKLLVINNYLE